MNQTTKETDRKFIICLISLLLCFVSSFVTITLSNQNRFTEPLEIIGLSIIVCFGVLALGTFI